MRKMYELTYNQLETLLFLSYYIKNDYLMETHLHWQDFMKVDMRVGTILSAELFKEAKMPAYKMIVDFGEFGKRKTSAQITKLYAAKELIGKQVVAVINFPPKQIANMMSECLVLGVVGLDNDVTLLSPTKKVINGLRIG